METKPDFPIIYKKQLTEHDDTTTSDKTSYKYYKPEWKYI